MKAISNEALKRLYTLHQSLKGTPDYMKYSMALDFKNTKGRWVFSNNFSVPNPLNSQYYYKKNKNDEFIVDEKNENRYKITSIVKNFLSEVIADSIE